MAPEPPKRHGGAPPQLAKLDVESERQKSAKRIVKSLEPEKKKAATNGNQPQDERPSSASAKPTTKPAVRKAAVKTGKVAVAVGNSEDQFNDIGEVARPSPGNQTQTRNGKTRPASAGVGQAKPAASARPASAGPVSGAGKSRKPSGSTQRQGSGSVSQPAADQTGGDADPIEASDETQRSLGDKEPAARGLYDIFVQTRRCEKLCYEVGLKLQHIRKMKKKFDDNDMYHTGEITQAEFYFIINEDRSPLTKGILQYGNVPPDQKFMSFDEYLLCVVSFAVLTPPEVYQFVFDLYDADQSGTLDKYEFAKMSKELQSKQFCFPKNTETAIKMIEGKDPMGKRGSGGGGGYASEDGLVDLADFMKFAKLFPVVFFPLFNFQKNVRRATLGESKWSNLAARKLKIQELVSHMRRNYGAIPEMSFGERLWSIVNDEATQIRKRASEIYSAELAQRRLIGDSGEDHANS